VAWGDEKNDNGGDTRPSAADDLYTPTPPEATLPSVRGTVLMTNVQFRYDAARDAVLRGVDLCVEAGTTVALVGPSGSGKRSLVDLLLRLREPTVRVCVRVKRPALFSSAAWFVRLSICSP
jgi:ABC-type multidrug transport system fused ATPase/permease subunit